MLGKSVFSILFAVLLLVSVTLILDNAYGQENSGQTQDAKGNDIEEKKQQLEEKTKEIQQKLKERLQKLEEKHQDAIKELSSDESDSEKIRKLEEKFHEKPDKIIQRLEEKSEKLNLRTQKLLEKINEGNYMGEKITLSDNPTEYKLIFNSISASSIGDKQQNSNMIGSMNFTTFDSSNTNLKLKLEECHILVDDIPYSCGFGKARTISFGSTGENNSLVIIAFLEDNLSHEVHTTLKIFLQSDIPISQIEESNVEILGPQSKVSHLWFLNGTATFSKIFPLNENIDDENEGKNITINLKENISMSDK